MPRWALLARPRILILDEPDSRRRHPREVVRELVGVLVISHSPIAVELADDVVELDGGRLRPAVSAG